MTNRRVATLGVLLGIFLAAIDGTIVSTAMPTVVQSLGGLQLYAWAFAAYMLFAAVSMPLYGRLADIYGRKRLFFVGAGIFVGGSALCGAAGSMLELVAFRSLQGIGAGAMFAIPYTILGVVYPPEERGRAIGLGSTVWGISSVIGPLLGFLIVSTVGWRGVFYLSVPVGLLAVLLVWVSLDESTGSAERDIDFLGAAVLSVAVGTLLVGLQLLETTSSWALPLIVVGIVGFGAFYAVEKRASQPIVPLSMFDDTVFITTNVTGFLTSFVLFAAITYVPLYLQSVQGGAESAALAVFPISIGWSGTSFLSGRLVNRVGEQRLATVGSSLLVVSFGVATVLWTATTPVPVVVVNVFVMGVGMGMVTPPLLTAIQNHFGTELMGVVTSSQQFFRNLGGTMGVALLGFALNLVIQNRLAATSNIANVGELQQRLLGSATPPAGLASILTDGLTTVFGLSVVVSILAVGFAYYIPRKRAESSAQATAGD
ncbi:MULTISPECIES: MFS transporter [unclassified Haladaptatus]|uniref:MFS transporter n=1 Tax=unclassified Haladaptatus TaxID=2622732 RepID=UPI00209BE78C|nr:MULTISPECIES: MFS transporter [unclassified Haladaptatus]MCO8245735.1 MFS transporter [Haladaptatus sp. AB643]MCO8256080.1 MFS transporter [Haladaptatus sp. AB618]